MTDLEAKDEADRLLGWRPLSEPPLTPRWVLLRMGNGKVYRFYFFGDCETFEDEMLMRLVSAATPLNGVKHPVDWKPSIETFREVPSS